MRVWPTIGLVLLLSGPALVVADPPDSMKPLHWKIGGERREAIVLFPKTPRNKPAPLVFYFHGHGGKMENFVRRIPIQKYWPEAAVVFMQGLTGVHGECGLKATLPRTKSPTITSMLPTGRFSESPRISVTRSLTLSRLS